MDIEFDNKRQDIRGSRRHRLLARTVDSKRGKAVYSDGFFSVDGIPTRIEGRKQIERQEWTGMKLLRFIESHPVSVPYCVVMMIVAIVLQGWIHV